MKNDFICPSQVVDIKVFLNRYFKVVIFLGISVGGGIEYFRIRDSELLKMVQKRSMLCKVMKGKYAWLKTLNVKRKTRC